MSQITIVPHGDSAALVVPLTLLETAGLKIGDQINVKAGEQQLILESTRKSELPPDIEPIIERVFNERADAFRRLA